MIKLLKTYSLNYNLNFWIQQKSYNICFTDIIFYLLHILCNLNNLKIYSKKKLEKNQTKADTPKTVTSLKCVVSFFFRFIFLIIIP